MTLWIKLGHDFDAIGIIQSRLSCLFHLTQTLFTKDKRDAASLSRPTTVNVSMSFAQSGSRLESPSMDSVQKKNHRVDDLDALSNATNTAVRDQWWLRPIFHFQLQHIVIHTCALVCLG
jgi:hypothetical protein